MGHSYYEFAKTIDNCPVLPERVRISIGAENTYLTDIDDPEDVTAKLCEVADEVWRRDSKRNFYGLRQPD